MGVGKEHTHTIDIISGRGLGGGRGGGRGENGAVGEDRVSVACKVGSLTWACSGV